MKVAILGAGPSAAYAASACDALKVESQVISVSPPPMLYPGAFWPRVNPLEKDMPLYKIYISRTGSAIQYLRKQWGMVDEDWLLETSFPKEARYEMGLNPYELFPEIWKTREILYCSDPLTDDAVAEIAESYDTVLMTFPTQRSKKIFKHELIRHPIISYKVKGFTTINYCIYDGEDNEATTRMSSLFGFIHNEYTKDFSFKKELIESGQVTWAIDSNPGTPEWNLEDTPADNVYLIGRHAQWSRKKLAHHAFDDVIAILDGDN